MTEQQIDAELNRWKPFWSPSVPGWQWWQPLPLLIRLKGELSPGLFERLQSGFPGEGIVRTYPTREAAFADLRQAIAATSTNAGGEA